MICSGGPTVVRAKDWVIMNLAKLIGVGAGKNDGLLLVHGKAVCSHLAQRKYRVSKLARLVKTQIHQRQKLQFQSSSLHQMVRELQGLGDCLTQQMK